jgi:hypothetical protein
MLTATAQLRSAEATVTSTRISQLHWTWDGKFSSLLALGILVTLHQVLRVHRHQDPVRSMKALESSLYLPGSVDARSSLMCHASQEIIHEMLRLTSFNASFSENCTGGEHMHQCFASLHEPAPMLRCTAADCDPRSQKSRARQGTDADAA